jgi:hypothetical protein
MRRPACWLVIVGTVLFGLGADRWVEAADPRRSARSAPEEAVFGSAPVPAGRLLSQPWLEPRESGTRAQLRVGTPFLASAWLPRRRLASDPISALSTDAMLSTLAELTAIGADSLWRTAGSRGEAAARQLVTERLRALPFLNASGLTIEQQSFHLPVTTEVWQTRLVLRTGGRDVEVPAHALFGSQEILEWALRMDTDGKANDLERNPITEAGPILPISSLTELERNASGLAGRIVILNYSALDSWLVTSQSTEVIKRVLAGKPRAILLLTSFSNQVGTSHGHNAGETGFSFSRLAAGTTPPVLVVRLEDLTVAGVSSWDDLATIDSAEVTLDLDVFSPGDSANTIATIPGKDRSRNVILGAHLDSPNSPGALDDGSGSAILLEVARVLDAERMVPPNDLVLVWFGAEETGLQGSLAFASAFSELLDASDGMLNVDCLGSPLDGLDNVLALYGLPYVAYGDEHMAMVELLGQRVADKGVVTTPILDPTSYADQYSFAAFDVPTAHVISEPFLDGVLVGLHPYAHWHDPYDTVELARKESGMLWNMAAVAWCAAQLGDGRAPNLRATPTPDRRALILGSHTEPPSMSPSSITQLGMALAWAGFDVDSLPYGRNVTSADLEGVDLVVALPVVDIPTQDPPNAGYDEYWSTNEAFALWDYVGRGGKLIVAGSAYRTKWGAIYSANEDARAINALTPQFGVVFSEEQLSATKGAISAKHALTTGVVELELPGYNALSFTIEHGVVLARADKKPLLAVVPYGSNGGEVLIVGDLSLLSCGRGVGSAKNLPLWRNISAWAR